MLLAGDSLGVVRTLTLGLMEAMARADAHVCGYLRPRQLGNSLMWWRKTGEGVNLKPAHRGGTRVVFECGCGRVARDN